MVGLGLFNFTPGAPLKQAESGIKEIADLEIGAPREQKNADLEIGVPKGLLDFYHAAF